MPDAVTGVAWPSLCDTFHLSVGSFGFGLAGAGSGYFLSGLAAGTLTNRLGIGGMLSLSCLLAGGAMLGMALTDRPWWLLVWPVVWGLGSGGIDASLNNYAAHHFPPRHMNWLHASYSAGAAIGPLQMTYAILIFGSWRLGYAVVAIAMFAMMLAFVATRRRWQDGGAPAVQTRESVAKSSLWKTLGVPAVWLQISLFFLYTGLEALLGQWSFSLLTRSRESSQATAGIWVGVYFAAIAGGRLLAGFMTERYGISRWMKASLCILLVGACLLQLMSSTTWSGLALAVIGLGLAPIFPCLMSETPLRMGPEFAPHAIGLQVAAAVVGAVSLPSLVGFLIPITGFETVSLSALLSAVLLFVLYQRSGVTLPRSEGSSFSEVRARTFSGSDRLT